MDNTEKQGQTAVVEILDATLPKTPFFVLEQIVITMTTSIATTITNLRATYYALQLTAT
eukprot:gene5528-7209_t